MDKQLMRVGVLMALSLILFSPSGRAEIITLTRYGGELVAVDDNSGTVYTSANFADEYPGGIPGLIGVTLTVSGSMGTGAYGYIKWPDWAGESQPVSIAVRDNLRGNLNYGVGRIPSNGMNTAPGNFSTTVAPMAGDLRRTSVLNLCWQVNTSGLLPPPLLPDWWNSPAVINASIWVTIKFDPNPLVGSGGDGHDTNMVYNDKFASGDLRDWLLSGAGSGDVVETPAGSGRYAARLTSAGGEVMLQQYMALTANRPCLRFDYALSGVAPTLAVRVNGSVLKTFFPNRADPAGLVPGTAFLPTGPDNLDVPVEFMLNGNAGDQLLLTNVRWTVTDWAFSLTGVGNEEPLVCGMRGDATAGADLDLDVPGEVDDWLQFIGTDGQPWRHDFREPQDEDAWLLHVQPGATPRRLEWDPATVPAHHCLTLVELDADGNIIPGTAFNLRTRTGLDVPAGAARFFRLAFGLNARPVLAPIANLRVRDGDMATFTATYTDSNQPPEAFTFSLDPDAVALGATINPETGVFMWTPTADQFGNTYPMTVTVSDGDLSASQSFAVHVHSGLTIRSQAILPEVNPYGWWARTDTWEGGIVPTPYDDVEILGPVAIHAQTVAAWNLKVAPAGTLSDSYGATLNLVALENDGAISGTDYGLTLHQEQGVINRGTFANRLHLTVVGNVLNQGAWNCPAGTLHVAGNLSSTHDFQHETVYIDGIGPHGLNLGVDKKIEAAVICTAQSPILTATSDLVFAGMLDLNGGVLDMTNHGLNFMWSDYAHVLTSGTLKSATLSGTLYLRDAVVFDQVTVTAAGTLINAGYGNLHLTWRGTLTNRGTIHFAGWFNEILAEGDVVNEGTVSTGVNMTVAGSLTNRGTWSNGGAAVAVAGNVLSTGDLTNSSLTFTGAGIHRIAFPNGGTLKGMLAAEDAAVSMLADSDLILGDDFAPNGAVLDMGGHGLRFAWSDYAHVLTSGTLKSAVLSGTLYLRDAVVFDQVTVTAAGTLINAGYGNLLLTSRGTLTNRGTIHFAGWFNEILAEGDVVNEGTISTGVNMTVAGSLTNRGIWSNGDAAIVVTGNILSTGDLTNSSLTFTGAGIHRIEFPNGGTLKGTLAVADSGTNTATSILADSDLVLTGNFVPNGTALDMAGHRLTFAWPWYGFTLSNGTIRHALLDGSVFLGQDVVFENVSTASAAGVYSNNGGRLTLRGTFANHGYFRIADYDHQITAEGDFVNTGTIGTGAPVNATSLTVAGNLSNSGTWDSGATAVSVAGNLQSTGNLSTGSLTFTGAGAHRIGFPTGGTINGTLAVQDATVGIVADADLVLSGNLVLSQGVLDMDGHRLTFAWPWYGFTLSNGTIRHALLDGSVFLGQGVVFENVSTAPAAGVYSNNGGRLTLRGTFTNHGYFRIADYDHQITAEGDFVNTGTIGTGAPVNATSLTVAGNLSNSGTWDSGATSVSVAGNLQSTGSLSNGSLTFTGAGAHRMGFPNGGTINGTLSVQDATVGIVADTDLVLSSNLVLHQGVLDMDGHRLTFVWPWYGFTLSNGTISHALLDGSVFLGQGVVFAAVSTAPTAGVFSNNGGRLTLRGTFTNHGYFRIADYDHQITAEGDFVNTGTVGVGAPVNAAALTVAGDLLNTGTWNSDATTVQVAGDLASSQELHQGRLIACGATNQTLNFRVSWNPGDNLDLQARVSEAASWQWYRNGVLLPEATGEFLRGTAAGVYWCETDRGRSREIVITGGWRLLFTLTGAEPTQLVLGQTPLATDGFDDGLDVAVTSPLPTGRAGSGRAALATTEAEQWLQTDIRGSAGAAVWNLTVRAAADPVTLMWDPAGIPAGKIAFAEELSETQRPRRETRIRLDTMPAVGLQVPAGETRRYVVFYGDRRTLALKRGWNLLSLPVEPWQPGVADILGEAPAGMLILAPLWQPGGALQPATEIHTGTGFWLYARTALELDVYGDGSAHGALVLDAGWNLAGTVVPLSLPSLPGLHNWAWAWNGNGYESAKLLVPGRGYWIYAATRVTVPLPQ